MTTTITVLKKNSHIPRGKIKGNCRCDFFSVFEVAKESDGDVETGNDDHAGVENAGPTTQGPRLTHLVLQGQNNSDPFEGVDRSAKI